MRLFNWFADQASMTVNCCVRDVPTITIETPHGHLAVGCCPRCDRRRWFHDGAEIAVRDVLELASRSWATRGRRLRAVA
jgi:hypothetical protein